MPVDSRSHRWLRRHLQGRPAGAVFSKSRVLFFGLYELLFTLLATPSERCLCCASFDTFSWHRRVLSTTNTALDKKKNQDEKSVVSKPKEAILIGLRSSAPKGH